MRIIDEKGKIFGLINIIDLIVLLVLALVVIGGGMKILKKSPEVVAENKKAIVEMEITEVRKPTVDGIEEGDMLYYYDRGQVFGKIVEKKVESLKEAVATNDGKIVLAEVPEKYVVKMQVEVSAIDTENVVIIGGEHTRIGNQIRLKNKNIAVFATVLGVDIVE